MSDLDAARGDLAFLRGLVDEDWRPGVWSFGALYFAAAVGVGFVVATALALMVVPGLRMMRSARAGA